MEALHGHVQKVCKSVSGSLSHLGHRFEKSGFICAILLAGQHDPTMMVSKAHLNP